MLKYCFDNDCPCDEESRVYMLLMEDTSTVFDFFRQTETFAKDGKRSGRTSSMRWSHGHVEIFRRRKKDI